LKTIAKPRDFSNYRCENKGCQNNYLFYDDYNYCRKYKNGWPDFSTPCQNYKAPKPEIEAKNPEIEAKKDNCDPIIYDSIESLEL